MNKTSKSSKQAAPKKLQFTVIAIVIAIVAAVGVAIAMSRKSDNSKQTIPQGSGSVSLQGELVCLPHKNTEGPQTLECAIGFKSEEGKYYSLKDEANKASAIPFNKPVEVTGTYRPETSEIYQSVGSITVTDIKEYAH